MEYGTTSYNRIVYASPPSATRTAKIRVLAFPCAQFFSATVFASVKMLCIFPYGSKKTVIYNKSVVRKAN